MTCWDQIQNPMSKNAIEIIVARGPSDWTLDTKKGVNHGLRSLERDDGHGEAGMPLPGPGFASYVASAPNRLTRSGKRQGERQGAAQLSLKQVFVDVVFDRHAAVAAEELAPFDQLLPRGIPEVILHYILMNEAICDAGIE